MDKRLRMESPTDIRKPQLISPHHHQVLGQSLYSQLLRGKSSTNRGTLLIVIEHPWVVGWREVGQFMNALASSLFTATPLPNKV